MNAGVTGALLAALLLAAGAASAGTEARPEISDPRDVEAAVADILAVWLEPDPDGVKLSVKVASLPRERPNLVFVVLMGTEGGREAPTLGFRNGGGLLAQQEFGGEGRGNDLLKPSFRPGTPATLSAVIPWSAYGGLRPGERLLDLEAYSSVFLDGQWRAPYDTTDMGATYVIASAGPSAAPASAAPGPLLSPWVLPAAVLAGCTLAGALLGAYVARARRRASRAR